METKRLHELIELAKAGKKFSARRTDTPTWEKQNYFCDYNNKMATPFTWNESAVVLLWEYKEIREPLVLEFEFDCRNHEPDQAMNKDITYETYLALDKKKWRIVATEILEET